MKKWIHASTDTRSRISYLEERIEQLKEYIDDCRMQGCYEDTVDEQIELAELEEQLNFAWQDDEEEYNYAVQQQEFNPDGSLKLYGSTQSKRYQVVLRDGELYRDPYTDDIIEINSRPIIKEVSSLEEAMRVYQQYLRSNHITSSENTGGLVLQNDEPVAVLSYNGNRIDNFNDYIKEWGKGILYNSNVLKSLGYGIEASTSIKGSAWNVSEPSASEYGKAMEQGRKRMEERYAPFVVKSLYRSPTSSDTPGYVITLDEDNEWILYPDDEISSWNLTAKKYLLYGPYKHNEIRYADSKFYRNQKLFSTNHFKWVDDAVSFLFTTQDIDPE